MVRGTDEKNFYWDGNVAAMAESTAADGMTMQRTAADGAGEGSRSALHDLYNDLEDIGIPNPYSRQGEDQPFGYTGYRHDEISGTYFAQAREYQPQNGRFTAQDVIKGNGAIPETLNRYGYCLGNPVGLVDRDGMEPTTQDEWETMTQEEWEAMAPNICHSFWYTPEGLWSGQAELPLDYPKLRMSEKGKEVLRYYELGDKKTEWNEKFEADTLKMTENMLKNFDDRTLSLTIQQLDALILYRFQHGTLGPQITALVESGALKEEWDKVITDASSQRNQAVKQIYWGDVFDYDEVCLEDD